MVRGLLAAECSDCGVEGLSGEMERARSAHKDISLMHAAPHGHPRGISGAPRS